MAGPAENPAGGDQRGDALIGLAGAVLSGIGDVLILGRPSSGRDFDRAAGLIPPHVTVDARWQSLWNGTTFTPRRIHLGTLTGLVGIGSLQWLGLRGIARAVRPGALRRIATSSAIAFAVSGVLTHLCCGAVILAYRRAATVVEPTDDKQLSLPSVTTLLAVSAAGALGALAAFSGSLTIEALRCRPAQTWRAVVTPFPCVLTTLLAFGVLPAPIAGYVRPASMSIGLVIYFAVAAALPASASEKRRATETP